ncbi:MAG TPA: biopolymer transporter ExbD [Candidatus Onthomorpha intestinigallinarum]|uniref:Biopolymer transporter ExbD n=1 Tax=Candidatus Onthomorpha intestinigallinarum TaxID=2840880 RepID=A0A9D1RIH6_9BACT|nr:biopolymer transporter ExbD [Candidatus Onthomorpha intestinigallinarum]
MIQTRNKIDPNFNSSSMSDLVFLLLIFFMLTSTLISPNAIKLLLPKSTSGQTLAKQNVTVSIDENNVFYVENIQTSEEELPKMIGALLSDVTDGTVKLHSDKSVAVQYVVTVIDAVNKVNAQQGKKHKVILATEAVK